MLKYFTANSRTKSNIFSRRESWPRSGGVRVQFPVRFQESQFSVDSQLRTQLRKQTASKLFLRGIAWSEYGSEGFRSRLRRLSEYGSVAYLVERPTRETRAEQYSDTVLISLGRPRTCPIWFLLLVWPSQQFLTSSSRSHLSHQFSRPFTDVLEERHLTK